MLNTGRLAAPQYQKIMAQGTDYFKLTIQNYLDARAREDELFAPRYANPKKNIDDCCTFIINQVRQSGCNGFADEEIYSMALHYYDEEDIDIGKPVSCVLTKDEQDVRGVMEVFARKKLFNALFAFGYGAHHLWVTQKKASDPDQCLENRLLIVEF